MKVHHTVRDSVVFTANMLTSVRGAAEDGAHQVLRHLQRGAAHGGG